VEDTVNKSAYTDHLFQFRSVERRKLILSLIITTTVMVVEILGGFITNSIALLSDAGHMFTHAFAISISLLAILISKKPACHHKTFGLYRAEVLAAFINGLFLIPIVGIIIYEAIIRFLNPQEIFGFYMLIVAIIGLSVNITSILILQGSHKTSLNVKSVFSWGILRDSTRILLEMAPKGMNIEAITEDLKNNFPEILDVFDSHLWIIIPNMLVFSAHIKLKNEIIKSGQEEFISKINDYLSNRYKIIESTIQILSKDAVGACNF
jgi:cobalt-zinc-cadmium efflux system protein